MEIRVANGGKCKAEIYNEDGYTTVVLTELTGSLLKNTYEVVATSVYQQHLKGKADPKCVVWLGHLPAEGHFEILMPWHADRSGYGPAQWYKRKSPPANLAG